MKPNKKALDLINMISQALQNFKTNSTIIDKNNQLLLETKAKNAYDKFNWLFRDFILFMDHPIKNIGINTIDFYNHLVYILISLCGFGKELTTLLIMLNDELLRSSNSTHSKIYLEFLDEFRNNNKKS